MEGAIVSYQQVVRPLQKNFLFPVHCPHRIWLLSALNIPLFWILPLFSGYSCILTSLVCQLTCQLSYQVGTKTNKQKKTS